MNQEITDFIDTLNEPWQSEIVTNLLETVHQAIPDVHERIQYKKPHFLKNGKYAAVISTSKTAVSFTIFNAVTLDLPEGVFNGPPERKTMKIHKGDTVDFEQLVTWVSHASAEL
ncbi:DUF1801 domain-containing protein [Halalkalibacter sp. APA_J-10(15)]|uniref:DUF1801 domain-containing protein n=1 Tax=Halalkalibacter sp. APA_J-10(15) TaxID=2933805 RepID=UPI001FF4077F|nr:DUF1801 domain-containing protein [Halalkalibacter sp. APA_J-10(15)]MCK0472307.1 DUF1801 domain-containing protein [Halalkalibacter sp. APA_J-10(15)]